MLTREDILETLMDKYFDQYTESVMEDMLDYHFNENPENFSRQRLDNAYEDGYHTGARDTGSEIRIALRRIGIL